MENTIDIDAKFGRELAQARAALKLTQTELADRAEMKQPNLARIETGKSDPRLQLLSALAGALGADIVIKPGGAIKIQPVKRKGGAA